ncbi:hypothetical protein CsSME_00036666 [Camellia sinensis var. sinensis]
MSLCNWSIANTKVDLIAPDHFIYKRIVTSNLIFHFLPSSTTLLQAEPLRYSGTTVQPKQTRC